MFTDSPQKISDEHLRRDAFLYVRQSSLRQVFENTESSQRQYALRERAVALGWPIERVHTIDSDLGISGAYASNRDGFQHLVSEVALGHAGIVLGLEVSRGELQMTLPIGLVYDASGVVALDPDQHIQHTVRMVFDTFRQVSSASAVVRRFAREGLRFPRRLHRGLGKGDVLWGALDQSRVCQILHNPRYAGAYVYGRSRCARTADLKSTTQIKVAREKWPVLIHEAHPGYIDWTEFEHNQATLKQNATAFNSHARGNLAREGPALLQGRILCGRCGARMRVRYQQLGAAPAPYYVCQEDVVRRAGKTCQSIRGLDVDAALSALLLQMVAPAALEVALAVQDEIAGRIEQANALRRAQLERARYEAELARRRYLKVDPDNRLVANTLEADWNERLRGLDALQQAHERQRNADQGLLSEEARRRILALATDFPQVWNDPRTAPRERKRMLALLVEDITLLKAERIAIHIRFRGGQTTSLMVERPQPMALIRKTKPEVIDALDALLETYTDTEAARQLNAAGHRTWQHRLFTNKTVGFVRRTYGLRSCRDRLLAHGFRRGQDLAKELGVSTTTIHELGRAGLLRRRRSGGAAGCLYEPLAGIKIIPGAGGRHPTPPTIISVQSSTQEAV